MRGPRLTPSPDFSPLLHEAVVLERAGKWVEARASYEEALGARNTLTSAERATVLRRIAGTYLMAGDTSAAQDVLAAAQAVSHAGHDLAGLADATNMLGVVHKNQGNLDEAWRLIAHARDQAVVAGHPSAVCLSELNLGTIANIRGDYRTALTHYDASLRDARMLALHDREAQVLNNVGMLHTDLGAWDEAEAAYERAEVLFRDLGQAHFQRGVEVNQVELWIARGRLDRARAQCERLLGELSRDSDSPWAGEVYKHYGVICLQAGEYGRADECFGRAAAIARSAGDLLLAAEVAREQAEMFWTQQRHSLMLRALNEAHAWFSQLGAAQDLDSVARRNQRLEARFLDIVAKWGDSIEGKDRYTKGHCERVASYACSLAQEAGIEDRTLFWFRVGALLHDVGKIAVPSEILNKQGPLTSEEWAIMRLHPEAGVRLLGEIDFPGDVSAMVRSHHERWDGAGYPDRLVGEAIPLVARILCVADVYDALTSTRSYRAGMPRTEALDVMRNAGGMFDPELFHLFSECCVIPETESGALSSRRGPDDPERLR